MRILGTVLIRDGKAYVPTEARLPSKMLLVVEPVQTVEVTSDGLVQALSRVISQGNPLMPEPTRDELRLRRDPLLAAAGVKSYKALARGAASYAIAWDSDAITVSMSMLDKQGRFVDDPAKTRTFPPDTDLQTIVEAILADVETRSEVRTRLD